MRERRSQARQLPSPRYRVDLTGELEGSYVVMGPMRGGKIIRFQRGENDETGARKLVIARVEAKLASVRALAA